MAFQDARKIDLQYSIINHAKHNEISIYHVNETQPNLCKHNSLTILCVCWIFTRNATASPAHPSAPPDEDEEVDSESSNSNNDDPPSWVQRDPDPPSWTVPRPPWVLVATGTDQRAGFGRPQGTEVQSFSRDFNQTTLSHHTNISILALKAATVRATLQC